MTFTCCYIGRDEARRALLNIKPKIFLLQTKKEIYTKCKYYILNIDLLSAITRCFVKYISDGTYF